MLINPRIVRAYMYCTVRSFVWFYSLVFELKMLKICYLLVEMGYTGICKCVMEPCNLTGFKFLIEIFEFF
jgi:hypothetical protein